MMTGMRRIGGTFFTTVTVCAVALSPILASADRAQAQPEWRAPPCIYATSVDKGGLCIRAVTYNRDLCAALLHISNANELPPGFFARLIWKESLFRHDAVSPKGAEGIAQFMPSTARMRGLKNSFDVLQALEASAAYLRVLRDRYGNLGFAAAAYNAGERGLEYFLRTGAIPFETRAYVLAITSHSVEEWRDTPPASLDLRLDKEKSFHDACSALADTRRMTEVVADEEGTWAPWGAQLSAHFQKSVAERMFRLTISRMPSPLNAEKPLIQRERNRAFGSRARYTARIGRQTRREAEAVCSIIRNKGGACIVFRN